MTTLRAACIFAALAATATPVAADTPFPANGVTTLCERDAPAGKAPDCKAHEYDFWVELKGKWAAIPEEFRASCVSEQAGDFAVYYSKLAVCISRKFKAARKQQRAHKDTPE